MKVKDIDKFKKGTDLRADDARIWDVQATLVPGIIGGLRSAITNFD